jgi:hypothetical protein
MTGTIAVRAVAGRKDSMAASLRRDLTLRDVNPVLLTKPRLRESMVQLTWPRTRDINPVRLECKRDVSPVRLLLVAKKHLRGNLKKPAMGRKDIRIPVGGSCREYAGHMRYAVPYLPDFVGLVKINGGNSKGGVTCYRFNDNQDKEITPLYFNISL